MTLGMPSATRTKLSTVIKLNKEPETMIRTEPQADINTMLCAVLSFTVLEFSLSRSFELQFVSLLGSSIF
jgi:hypothetical protein